MLLITLNFSIREYNCSTHRERTTQSRELGHILSDTCQLVILGKSLYLDVNVGGSGTFGWAMLADVWILEMLPIAGSA